MNTWVIKAAGGETCGRSGCDDEFAAGLPMVRMVGAGLEVSFHMVCWLMVAKDLAGDNVPAGPRRLELDKEIARARLGLLRKHAAIKQRIDRYSSRLAADPGSSVLRMLVLRQYLTKAGYRVEIERLGGVPRSWGDGNIPEELLRAS